MTSDNVIFNMPEEQLQKFHLDAKGALMRAAQGESSALDELIKDPLKLRAGINQAIGRLEGAERLVIGDAYVSLQSQYFKNRFEERALPALTHQKVEQWAKQMLSAGQEHPLKKQLAQLEQSIINGDLAKVKEAFEKAPMAPWIMDFTLRQYEAENLLMFVCKYCPAPHDLDIIDLIVKEGLTLPARNVYMRLESAAMSSAIRGVAHKGGERIGECLKRAGWIFAFEDYLWLFAHRGDDYSNRGDPNGVLTTRVLKEKIELAKWISAQGVSPKTRLPIAKPPQKDQRLIDFEELIKESSRKGSYGSLGDTRAATLDLLYPWMGETSENEGNKNLTPSALIVNLKDKWKEESLVYAKALETLRTQVSENYIDALQVLCQKQDLIADGCFGLEELFSVKASPLRDIAEWAEICPWLISEGIDLSKIHRIAISEGHDLTQALIYPWVEQQSLEKTLRSEFSELKETTDQDGGVKKSKPSMGVRL